MHHEHQNPKWWYKKIIADNPDEPPPEAKYFFGPGSWFCENLADYQAAVDRINADPALEGDEQRKMKLIELICEDPDWANHYKFNGAVNWLPKEDAVGPEEKNEPDWKSIMTCKSFPIFLRRLLSSLI